MDHETFQAKALEVRMPDDSYDPSNEPQDGSEYLTKVVYERCLCPAIVVANPPKKSKIEVIELGKDISGIFTDKLIDQSPPCLRFSLQWKETQLNDFELLRQKIIDLRCILKNNDYSLDDNIPFTNDCNEWKVFCQNNPPLLSIILRIDQRSLENLLKYEMNWLQNECNEDPVDLTEYNNWLGSWIYATLACLQLPLEPNIHSLLREIAKICILNKNKLNSDDAKKAIPLTLFILIISKTFNQLDLLEYI